MDFNGSIIKNKTKDVGYTLKALAKKLGVSRQTINSWIGGQVPRGQHFVKLCTFLDVRTDDFFDDSKDKSFSVPLHRTFKGKSVSNQMRKISLDLAKQYLNLFRQAPTTSILPVARIQKRTEKNAQIISEYLRKCSEVPEGKPMDYKSAFRLLSQLGIYVIFRAFPDKLKKGSYAFYSRIAGQRIIFINTETNVLDLIFQLLHETVHAIRDEEPAMIDNTDEEKFCDMVAEFAQFPDFYFNLVIQSVSSCKTTGEFVNVLKRLSKDNAHSLWGIYYRLRHNKILKSELNVGGAATNLNKKFPKIKDILFSDYDPHRFVDILSVLSPKFMQLLEEQIPHCSIRKFAEWIGLETSMDAQLVMDEIKRRKVTI